jgi:drug/metabolite transporter (DMT)-like permease
MLPMRPATKLTARHPALPYVLMLLGAAAFSVMAMFTVALKESVDWQWIAIARAGLAMTFAAIMAKAAGKQLVFLRPRKLWIRSIAGSISLVCGFYAMTHYPVSEVLTLTNMFPLWVAVLSLPLLGHWPSLDVWPAVILGLAGVVLIQQPFGGAPIAGITTLTGQIAVAAAMVSSFTSAVALIGLHHVREIDPRAVVAHFSGVALACCIAALFIFPTHYALTLDCQTLLLLLGVGVSATVGQILLTLAFGLGSPARVSVVGLSQVGFTMLLEIAISHRSFNPVTLVGIALVLGPTAWTLLRGAPETSVEDVPLAPSKDCATCA